MQKFIALIIRKPTAVVVIIATLFIVGFVSVSKLDINYLPDMEIPIISVKTKYNNAGPEEVEKSITRTIEGVVSSVNNVKNIKSKSKESESNIEIEFNWGTDLRTASDDIREAIDMIRNDLPDDADNPNISKFSSDSTPIMEIAFFGSDNLGYLYDLVDGKILNSLNQIDGVGQTEIRGGLKRVVCVDADLNRLNAYSININDIMKAIENDNKNIFCGETYEGIYKYGIRATGEFKDLHDIEDVVVVLKDNNFPVRVRDIAYVYKSYDNEAEIVRINGNKALTVAITKESDGNIIKIARDIENKLKNINLPDGVYYKILFDSSETIKNSIKNVANAIWQGFIFNNSSYDLFMEYKKRIHNRNIDSNFGNNDFYTNVFFRYNHKYNFAFWLGFGSGNDG